MSLSEKQVHVIVGARPNYMKVKLLMELLPTAVLIHSGQHYSEELFSGFLSKLGIRRPDVQLQPDRASQIKLISDLMVKYEAFWNEQQPDLVIVVGDVNSTAAAALVASRNEIPVAHIEAGLRSRDLQMPEEVNRILTDACSQFLFCSEPSGVENLKSEGRDDGVFLVGNTMIDCLCSVLPEIEQSPVLEDLGLESREYAVCTFHRPSNVDDKSKLVSILEELNSLGTRFVFPVHPRVGELPCFENITAIPPQFYFEFIKLVKESSYVVTDSGGLQEETTYLGVPCATLRPNTERPITIDQGTNQLLRSPVDLSNTIAEIRSRDVVPVSSWDGRATHRILDILERAIG